MAQALPLIDLSPKELAALSYLEPGFRTSDKTKVELTFILTDPYTQADFDRWLARTFESPQSLDYNALVASLWQKARKRVAADLAQIGQAALAQEVALWSKAETLMAECTLKGRPGKSFTRKQVTVLLQARMKK